MVCAALPDVIPLAAVCLLQPLFSRDYSGMSSLSADTLVHVRTGWKVRGSNHRTESRALPATFGPQAHPPNGTTLPIPADAPFVSIDCFPAICSPGITSTGAAAASRESIVSSSFIGEATSRCCSALSRFEGPVPAHGEYGDSEQWRR